MYRDSAPNLDPPDEIVWDGMMRGGDVMHIPRGYWHRATREDLGDGFSLHATFGMTKRTGVHWLSWLADHSRQTELFRRDLDRWGSVAERNVQQLALTEAASRLVANHTAADFLNGHGEQQPSVRHVATHGMFGAPSEVVCITEFPPIVEHGDALVTVRATGKKISFVERAWPALECFLSGRPASIEKVAAAIAVRSGQISPRQVGMGRRPLLDRGINVGKDLADGFGDSCLADCDAGRRMSP